MTEDSHDFWDDAFGEKEERRRPVNPILPPGAGTPYARQALANETAILAATTEGSRNHQLNESAFNLFQLVHGGYLSHDDVVNALHTVALGIGLTESETLDTLGSAWRGAAASPREVEQSDTVDAPELALYVPPTSPLDEDAPGEPVAPPSIGERFPALNWTELWADETEEEWILEPLLPARRLVALFSPPKVGKSLLMLELAVAVAAGTPVLGVTPDRPRVVLYVDFENDPRGDVRARLQAMGKTPDDLANLKYLSYPRLAYLDTFVGGLELAAIAEHYGAEVVVIDTISRAVNGEENDNDTWLSFYRHTGLTLKAAGIATIRLDHTGKDATKGMRGGSAKYGDVDAAWSMTKLSETAFQLECVANRLPIAEKQITIDRDVFPLRHRVNTGGQRAIHSDNVTAALAKIRELKIPADTTQTELVELLGPLGFVRAVARDAHRRWKNPGYSTHDSAIPDVTVYKED